MTTMMWVKCFVMMGVLLVCSYFDIKEKKVPLVCIAAGIAAVGILNLAGRDIGFLSCLIGTTLGIVLIIMSRLTKNAIGMGDALLVVMLGMGMGIYQTAMAVFYGLLVTAAVSAVLLVMKRVKKKTEIPFVPFLLIGYVGVILAWQV